MNTEDNTGGYKVFNYTDNIYASPHTYNNKKEANEFIKQFRNRFEAQGYYRDNRHNKVNPKDIDLLVIESDFSPFAKGGNVIDHYEIIRNVREEQGDSDFYYELQDKMVSYSDRPEIATKEFKKIFTNYDENMSDYISLPFAKGGNVDDNLYGSFTADGFTGKGTYRLERFKTADGENYFQMILSRDSFSDDILAQFYNENEAIKYFNEYKNRFDKTNNDDEYKKYQSDDWVEAQRNAEGYAKGGIIDGKRVVALDSIGTALDVKTGYMFPMYADGKSYDSEVMWHIYQSPREVEILSKLSDRDTIIYVAALDNFS